MLEQADRKLLHICCIEQPLEIGNLLIVFKQICRNGLKFSTSGKQAIKRSNLRIVGKQICRHGGDIHIPECLRKILCLDIVSEKAFRNLYTITFRNKWLQNCRVPITFSLKDRTSSTGTIKALSEISGLRTIHEQVFRNRLQRGITSERIIEFLGFYRIFEQILRNSLETVAVGKHLGKVSYLRERTADIIRNGFQFLICLADTF